MRKKLVVQVGIDDDGAAAMRPAAHVDRAGQHGRMARGVLDMDVHDRPRPAEALRAQADPVDALDELLLELGRQRVGVAAAHRAHERELGHVGRGVDGGADADAHHERRTGVQAVGRHEVEHELDDRLVALAGHEGLAAAGQRASAAGHVDVDLDRVVVGDDVPVQPRRLGAHVGVGVLLVEGLDGVVAQRRLLGGAEDGLLEHVGELVDIGELAAHAHEHLDEARVLARGAVQLPRLLLVRGHGLVDHARHGRCLLRSQLLELGGDVVRQALANQAGEVGDDIRQPLQVPVLLHLTLPPFSLMEWGCPGASRVLMSRFPG